MGAKRTGQVRFEAWVPQDLYEQFMACTPVRKAWLVAAMQQHVAAQQAPAVPAVHRHQRVRVGQAFIAGIDVGAWACATCGVEMP